MTTEQKAAILAACTRITKRAQLARMHAMLAAESLPSYEEHNARRFKPRRVAVRRQLAAMVNA